MLTALLAGAVKTTGISRYGEKLALRENAETIASNTSRRTRKTKTAVPAGPSSHFYRPTPARLHSIDEGDVLVGVADAETVAGGVEEGMEDFAVLERGGQEAVF